MTPACWTAWRLIGGISVADDETHLTEREVAIAKAAAKLAVQEISDEFYRQVGKTVVTKVLIWIGIAFVAFAAGKGWLAGLIK
jgi:hypothetical protein